MGERRCAAGGGVPAPRQSSRDWDRGDLPDSDDAGLSGRAAHRGHQYTLLFKSRVEIAVSPGQTRYGEVIARFPRLVVSYLRPWGIDPAGTESLQSESVQSESIDLEQALESLRAEGGEVSLQPVSYEEIARAGSEGFKGFSGGE